MAELNPPWALQNLATHNANVNRMFMSALVGRAEGVAWGFGVTQRGAGANMSVDVANGLAVVFGDENLAQGSYGVVNDATVNVVIAAADPTNARWDLIVCRVRDAFYSGATNAWDLFAVQGTPAGSPADPTVPNNALVLARVVVAAGASSITNANITDLRPFVYGAGGILPVNSARRPGVLYGPFSQEAASGFRPAPFAGMQIFETDTLRSLIYNGSAWVTTSPVSASVATSQTTGSTSFTDLATAGPAVSLQTGTQALVTVTSQIQNTAANLGLVGVAVSGATTLAASDNSALQFAGFGGGVPGQLSVVYLFTGLTAGVNTFTLKYRVTAGTGTFLNRQIHVVGVP